MARHLAMTGLAGRAGGWPAALVLGVGVWLAGAPAGAQSHGEASAKPAMQLQVRTLIDAESLVPRSEADPVWDLSPREERWLLQVPMRVQPAKAMASLTEPTIEVQPSRFQCWLLPESVVAEPGEGDDGAGAVNEGRGDARRGGAQNESNQQQGPPLRKLPPEAPRLLREGRIEPSGRLIWDLPRTIPGLEIPEDDDSLYGLKLQPQRLRALRPERPKVDQPQRPDYRNADSNAERRRMRRRYMEAVREARQEQQAAREAYREAVKAFRKKSQRVRALPSRFAVKLPRRLWAIFEVRRGHERLTFTGPAPLPWPVPLKHLVRARRLADRSSDELIQAMRRPARDQGRGPGRDRNNRLQRAGEPGGARRLGEEDDQAMTSPKPLLAWAREGHPYTHRLLAQMVVRRRDFAQMQVDGPWYSLFAILLDSEDNHARRRAVQVLRRVKEANEAVTQLLQSRIGQFHPHWQKRILKTLLSRWAQVNPGKMVATANTLLHEKDGPPVDGVLGALIEQIDREARAAATGPSMMQQAVTGITFSGLSEARRQQAVRTVIARAGAHELARRWLAKKLLGGDEPALVEATLNALGRAKLPGADRQNEDQPKDDQAEDAPEPIALDKPIALSDPAHPLLAMLQSDHETRQAQAWRALRRFKLAQADAQQRYGQNNENKTPIPSLITEASLATDHEDVAARLLREAIDLPGAAEALLTLTRRGGGERWRVAAHAALDAGETMQKTFASLEPATQVALARRFYRVQRDRATADQPKPKADENDATPADANDDQANGTAPAVPEAVQLLNAGPSANRLRDWFVKRLGAGTLPPAGQWIEAIGGERSALGLAHDNQAPSIRAAVAAELVAHVGGDETDARELAQTFTQQGKELTTDDLQKAWNKTRQTINARRLKQAAGQYKVVLINDADNASRSGAPARLELGYIAIEADGQSLATANNTIALSVASATVAIELDNPIDLKSLANDWLNDQTLAPIEAGQPIRLKPADHGAWQGALRVSGDKWQLRFEPNGES